MDLEGQIPRTAEELFRSKFPWNRANFGRSPRAKEYIVNPDLVDTGIWRVNPTTRTSVPTLPSRAHPKDDAR